MSTIASISNPQGLARLTGLIYLAIAVLAGFGYFGVVEAMLVPGDGAATAQNILDAPGLYRAGVAAFLAIIVLDLTVGWALFVLFAPAGAAHSLLALIMRIAYALIHGASLLFLVGVPAMLSASDGVEAAGPRILALLEAHEIAFMVALVFFGVHLIVLAMLVWRARYVPRLFTFLLLAAGGVYIADTFALVLWQDYAAHAGLIQTMVAIPAIIGEMGLTLWLIVRGIDTSRRAADLAGGGN